MLSERVTMRGFVPVGHVLLVSYSYGARSKCHARGNPHVYAELDMVNQPIADG